MQLRSEDSRQIWRLTKRVLKSQITTKQPHSFCKSQSFAQTWRCHFPLHFDIGNIYKIAWKNEKLAYVFASYSYARALAACLPSKDHVSQQT